MQQLVARALTEDTVLRLVLVISYSIMAAEWTWTCPWDTVASSPPRDCSSSGVRERFPLVPVLVCMVLVSFSHLQVLKYCLKRKISSVKGKGVPQPCSEIAYVHWVTVFSH